MKELFLGLGLILVIGVAGFAYRVIIERPQTTLGVCTEEAKICPNGASVVRSGPSCSFALCPFPNVTIPEIGGTLALPEGYSVLPKGEVNNTTYITSFTSTTTDPIASSIAVYRYSIPENGKDGQTILLAETTLSPSEEKPKSLDVFKKQSIGGREYYGIVTERFEGVVVSSYYFIRTSDVIRFDVVEHDVQNWTDSKLNIAELPAHKAFLAMLETAQL